MPGPRKVTVVRGAGQMPFFYKHNYLARRGYLFVDKTPLRAFGHGLSYTTFDVGALCLTETSIKVADTVTVGGDLTTTGVRSEAELVQMYLRDQSSSLTHPVLKLQGFERVMLTPSRHGVDL